MECTEFQAIVAGEREEDLSPAESLGFESHLDGCAACREAVSRAEEDLERLGQIADPPLVAASAWTRVDEAVRAEARKRPGREDPFAPLEVDEPAPPALAPAMPVTLARPVRGAGGAALPAPRSKPLLAFVACAAAAVIAVAFALSQPFERPARTDRNSGIVIGPVKPPEADDVKVLVDLKVGPSFKKLEKQGPLVVIPDGQ